MKTALHTLTRMPGVPESVLEATRPQRHPQERTLIFHEIFDAPVRNFVPNLSFSHMDDQRVAFRAAFIISEAIELLEKGLGLQVQLAVRGDAQLPPYIATGSDNGALTTAIQAAMADAGSYRNLAEVLDALGDLNVVVNGFGVELGVDMRVVDAEIFASNMTKLDEAGNPIISDGTDGHPKGKILKGPNFMEPQILAALGIYEGA